MTQAEIIAKINAGIWTYIIFFALFLGGLLIWLLHTINKD